MKTEITGHTRLVGLFATPIRHSVSPMIHNKAFETLGIDAVYLAFDLGEKDLSTAIASIKSLDMLGANLSMPHKMAAVPMMDKLSEAARLIGAVNTILHQDGKLIGHNTDGIGFMSSLKVKGIEVLQKKITVIGAGGAATAIIVQAALDGVKEIAVFNRKDDFFQKIQNKLAVISKKTSCNIQLYDLADQKQLAQEVAESRLLVNATGVGMSPQLAATPIEDFSIIHSDLAVYDVIYTPRETRFLKQAKEQGVVTSNGLGMLLYQGAAAFELWTGQKMPIEVVQPIIENC